MKKRHYVPDLQRPHILKCGRRRSTSAEVATLQIDVTCQHCLGRMMREAETDYYRHTEAAKKARHRVAQLSAQLRSGQLFL